MEVLEAGLKPILAPEELRALRSQHAKDLAAIVRGFVLVPTAPDFIPDFTRDERFYHAYGRLAEGLYGGFVKQAEASQDERLIGLSRRPSVLHGLYVLTRMLSYGPAAYASHLKAAPVETSLNIPDAATHLSSIMKRSKGILKLFADRDIKSNHALEVNFGLLQYPPTYETEPPFVIQPDGEGDLKFDASSSALDRTNFEIIRRRLEGSLPQPGPAEIHCPAIGIVLDTMWDKAVDECAGNPGLYPADLAELFESS